MELKDNDEWQLQRGGLQLTPLTTGLRGRGFRIAEGNGVRFQIGFSINCENGSHASAVCRGIMDYALVTGIFEDMGRPETECFQHGQ